MKTLLLMRHAKSSWKDATLRDFERPLNERGREAAPVVGRLLRRRKPLPDLVVSSPAERARETAALVTEAAALRAPLRHDERIYEATAAQLLEVVTQLDESAATALLVGHNPGMEELIETLTGAHERMPTAALACITLDVEKWSKARAGAGRLEWVARPKELDEG
ncbi:MAG TPA: histidine phosphatase family protein [Pyrinomonadaceae bacterium]|nr:histidine phosphatase family protein [Pyrinomonadaceae bacterium]